MYFDNINLIVNNNKITTSRITDLKVLKDTYKFVSSLEKMVQFIYKDRMTRVNYQTNKHDHLIGNLKTTNCELTSEFYAKEIMLGEDNDIKDIVFANMEKNASYDTTFMYISDNDTCNIIINDNEIAKRFYNGNLAIPYNDVKDFSQYNQVDANIFYTFQAIDTSFRYILKILKRLNDECGLQYPILFIDELLKSKLVNLNPDHIPYIWSSLPQDSSIRYKIANHTNKIKQKI